MVATFTQVGCARGRGDLGNLEAPRYELSTMLLQGRHASTYLKLAHTYLSTVDQIALSYGADGAQMEYAGDSVLAYFDSYTPAIDVVRAALWSRVAVAQIGKMPGALGTLKFRCKIVVDYDRLVVSKIGPRAGAVLTAIGHPIHRVAKTEKLIGAGIGRASIAFHSKVPDDLRKYFVRAYEEVPSLNVSSTIFASPPAPPPSSSSLGLMGGMAALGLRRGGLEDAIFAPPAQPRTQLNALAGLYSSSPPPPAPAPAPRTHIGYDFKWPLLFKDVGVPFSPD